MKVPCIGFGRGVHASEGNQHCKAMIAENRERFMVWRRDIIMVLDTIKSIENKSHPTYCHSMLLGTPEVFGFVNSF